MLELHSDQAEQSVIGGLLIQPDAIDQIHWLNPASLFFANNREIYRAICELIAEAKPVDIVTVAEALDSRGNLKEVGGLSYLNDLKQASAGAGNIKRYAEIVQERATLRALMGAVTEIQNDIQAPGDVIGKLERAQSAVMAITEKSQTSEPMFVGDILPDRIARFDALMQGEIKNVGTGFEDLDRVLGGGIENSDLVIIAARPSMGKTALAVQLAEHMQKPKQAALVFSCEMANGQIVDRIIASHSRIASDKLRSGQFTDEDLDRLLSSTAAIKQFNMLVDDKTFTINSIRAKARTVKRKHGLSCVVVDYIQLLTGTGDNREQEVSSISRGLKGLAKELDVPVIALSQLSRKVEDRADKRPVMSDLRDSGAIEQDADVICFIYRDEYYNPDSPYVGTAEVIVKKNRKGATGQVLLHFDKEHTSFANHAGGIVIPMKQPRMRKGFGD